MILLIIITAIILMLKDSKEHFLDKFRPFWWTYPNFTDHRFYTYLTPSIDSDLPRHCKCEETCPSKVCDEYRRRMWHLRQCLRTNDKNCLKFQNKFGCHHSNIGNLDNFSLIDPCRTKCKLCPV